MEESELAESANDDNILNKRYLKSHQNPELSGFDLAGLGAHEGVEDVNESGLGYQLSGQR